MIDNRLLEILACPLCKAKLDHDHAKNELVCSKCKLAYSIDDDIPVMLVDQARNINEATDAK